ncbi:MAG: ATP-binding protein [Alphaproteobacteria bacterium]|nr:ATP-binding protein [Alphaproteobacteria bacterium]
MLGRTQELKRLENLYVSEKFEFLVMYGRRRVGKTTILEEFSKRHKCIFFSAQEKNDALNLQEFSKLVQIFFEGMFISCFQNWDDAFDYIGRKSDDKTVLIIDEFPFLASSNPTIKSILQHKIDHDWKNKKICLILCGSSVSFMVNDVMGYKSPLYGRITEQMQVLPFDYFESAEFFPNYSDEDKVLAFGILGGVPRYLSSFDPNVSLKENVKREILRNGSILNDEPETLLKMELREPGIYNSILEAIATGCNKISLISDRIHEEKSKCSKYLLTLQCMQLVEKQIPYGENSESKKGIYEISDNFYKFWYRFIFTNKNYFNLLGIEKACDEIFKNINDYMGPVFEKICIQYLTRLCLEEKIPFVPFKIGKWWGNNSFINQQDDIDIMGISKDGLNGIFCECKFRNKPMAMEEYDDLLIATKMFKSAKNKKLVFISKSGFTKPVLERAKKEETILLELKDLFLI